jgi:hypothetical protein
MPCSISVQRMGVDHGEKPARREESIPCLIRRCCPRPPTSAHSTPMDPAMPTCVDHGVCLLLFRSRALTYSASRLRLHDGHGSTSLRDFTRRGLAQRTCRPHQSAPRQGLRPQIPWADVSTTPALGRPVENRRDSSGCVSCTRSPPSTGLSASLASRSGYSAQPPDVDHCHFTFAAIADPHDAWQW